MNQAFGAWNDPLNKEGERAYSLKGQTYKDVSSGSKFVGADDRKGEQAFGRIVDTVSSKHGSFNYYQKDQQIRNPNYNPLTDDPSEEFLSSNSQAGNLNQNNPQYSEEEIAELQQVHRFLIEDIKKHANEFEFKTIITFKGQYYDAINSRWVEYKKEEKNHVGS